MSEKEKNTHFHYEGRWRDSKSGEGGRGRLGTLEISTYVLLDLMEVASLCIWWYIWQTTGSDEVTAVVLLLPSSPCVRRGLGWDVNSDNLLFGKGTGCHVLFVLITYYREFMKLIFQLAETILCNPDLQVTPLKSGTGAHTRAMPLQTHMCWHPGTHRDVSPHLPTCTERLSTFLPPEVILSDSRWSLAPPAVVNSNNVVIINSNNNSNNDRPHGLPALAKSLKEQRKYLGLAKCVSGI